MICDKKIVTLLETLEDKFEPIVDSTNPLIKLVGILNKTIKVYVYEMNTYGLEKSRLVVGYRGAEPYDSAYVLSPYVLILMIGKAMDPIRFLSLYKFATRYGKYVIKESTQEKYNETFRNYYKSLTVKLP
jgi:hypothetical protein